MTGVACVCACKMRSAANLHNYLYTYLKGEKGYNWDASKLGAPMYSNFVTKSWLRENHNLFFFVFFNYGDGILENTCHSVDWKEIDVLSWERAWLLLNLLSLCTLAYDLDLLVNDIRL